MDAFKKVVLASVLVTIVALGFTAYVIADAIEGTKIPSQEYGLVTSKGPVTDGRPANYSVNLADGRTFYITSNVTAYEILEVNITYLFTGRLDVKNGMTIIDSAWQTNRTAIA